MVSVEEEQVRARGGRAGSAATSVQYKLRLERTVRISAEESVVSTETVRVGPGCRDFFDKVSLRGAVLAPVRVSAGAEGSLVAGALEPELQELLAGALRAEQALETSDFLAHLRRRLMFAFFACEAVLEGDGGGGGDGEMDDDGGEERAFVERVVAVGRRPRRGQ